VHPYFKVLPTILSRWIVIELTEQETWYWIETGQ